MENMDIVENKKLDALAMEVKIAESETGGFMEPGTKVKRGRGRPKKDGSTSTSSAQPKTDGQKLVEDMKNFSTKDLLKPLVIMLGGVASQGYEELKPSNDEIETVSTGLGIWLDKKMPSISEENAGLILVAMGLGGYAIRTAPVRKEIIQRKKSKVVTQVVPKVENEDDKKFDGDMEVVKQDKKLNLDFNTVRTAADTYKKPKGDTFQ